MIKSLVVGLVLAAGAVWTGAMMNHGCRDIRTAHTHLVYWPTRDMRHTIAITPNKYWLRTPDSLTVPTIGREAMPDPAVLTANREAVAAHYTDTTATDDSSLARGERMFRRLCVPCHGASMQGNGPVAARFMPPPDLLGATTRGRSDGYIYTYVRFGGAIMPRYGQALTVHETWDVIHYLRHQQKTSPR